MQDRYAGDIGDYGKFTLLRELNRSGFKVGVNWYMTEIAEDEKHEDGRYRIPDKYHDCDSDLVEKLYEISMREGSNRCVAALEEAQLIPDAVYYEKFITSKPDRQKWHEEAVETLATCDIVFLDPDNGLSVKSVGEGSRKSVKYVYLREIADYVSHGQSVVFYNHRQRKAEDRYFSEMAERFAGEPELADKNIHVVTFPRLSVRDYFVFSVNTEHDRRVRAALRNLVNGPFGEKHICFQQPRFSDSGLV